MLACVMAVASFFAYLNLIKWNSLWQKRYNGQRENTPKLLKEIPHQTESNHKIAVGRRWRGEVVVTGDAAVEVF